MGNDINKLKIWQKLGIACLIIVISGFVGWLVEFMFYYIDHGKLHWKGGNFLPWINIYSVGAFLILKLTHKHWQRPVNVFIISILSAGLLEFLTGFVLFEYFGIRYWNYENEFLNIGGYICLLSLLCMGIGGIVLVYFVLPKLIKLSEIIPKNIFLAESILLFLLVFSDEIYNFFITKLFDLPRAIDIYNNIFISTIFK